MSADIMAAGAEAELQIAVLDALRADAGVQDVLGSPARIFDGETDAPLFPYVELERHDVRPRGSAGRAGQAHTITFGLRSRSGGRADAVRILSALRQVIDGLGGELATQTVLLSQTLYADVMRTPDLREFRGVLRVRIITEEAG